MDRRIEKRGYEDEDEDNGIPQPKKPKLPAMAIILHTNILDFRGLHKLQISITDIKLATNNFSNDNLIARGGFGKVYKGQLPKSNNNCARTVAIKRLDKEHGQGLTEFLSELVTLSRCKHHNLVPLIGICDEGGEKILVYEYMARGSLDKYLATKEKNTDLNWLQRLNVCLGAAKGLYHLHYNLEDDNRVLHGDIKSSNILLDENWDAKVSDFGFAKWGRINKTCPGPADDDVCGTVGYVDPVYMQTRTLTAASDVYSFGIVLFEVLCGRLAIGPVYRDLGNWAAVSLENGNLKNIIPHNLYKQMNQDSLQEFSKIAYRCVNKNQSKRPDMKHIVKHVHIALKYQVDYRPHFTKSELWGSTRGDPWSFLLKKHQKLKKVLIDHDKWIYSIQFIVEANGQSYTSLLYGRHGGGYLISNRSHEINLEEGEEIIGISGNVGYTLRNGFRAGVPVIMSLTLMTNERNHGPYGRVSNENKFEKILEEDTFFAGFYGRSGGCLDAIGLHLKTI